MWLLEVHKSANKGEIEQLVEWSKRNEQTLSII